MGFRHTNVVNFPTNPNWLYGCTAKIIISLAEIEKSDVNSG